MNIEIRDLQKAEHFACIFQHIRLFTECINIMFEPRRMYIQTMDSARVCIVEIVLPCGWFDTYECAEPVTLGVNSTTLYKILNSRDKVQTIRACFEDDTLTFDFTGENKGAVFDKHFELPLMELDEETMAIPAIDYQAEFSLPSANFASIVNQLKLFGDTMDVSCNEEKIALRSSSIESANMSVDIHIDDLTEFSINEGEDLRVSFSLSYLHNFCMYHKLSNHVEVKISTNYPMKVVYPLASEGASLSFFLAPKLEDSD